MIRHLTKGGQGRRAIYRGGGAIDIIGSARTAFLVGPHPQDDSLRVLACTKINMAEPPPALGFRIAAGAGGQAAMTWTGPVDVAADDLVLAPGRPPGEAVAEARSFLEELLGGGPLSQDEIQRQAQEEGISRRTLSRAKSELRITSEFQQGALGAQWLWRLRAAAAEDTLDYAERRKRELAEAQRESDAIMARLRERYRNSKSSQ